MSERVRRALSLNEEFHRMVFEGRWQEACDTERERREMLQLLFDSPLEPPAHDMVMTALRQIQKSDQTLLRELEVARELCVRELGKLHHGQRGSNAYLMIGTGTLQ